MSSLSLGRGCLCGYTEGFCLCGRQGNSVFAGRGGGGGCPCFCLWIEGVSVYGGRGSLPLDGGGGGLCLWIDEGLYLCLCGWRETSASVWRWRRAFASICECIRKEVGRGWGSVWGWREPFACVWRWRSPQPLSRVGRQPLSGGKGVPLSLGGRGLCLGMEGVLCLCLKVARSSAFFRGWKAPSLAGGDWIPLPLYWDGDGGSASASEG